jgi:hypothetical protein
MRSHFMSDDSVQRSFEVLSEAGKRAETDPEFRKRLLQNTTKVLKDDYNYVVPDGITLTYEEDKESSNEGFSIYVNSAAGQPPDSAHVWVVCKGC